MGLKKYALPAIFASVIFVGCGNPKPETSSQKPAITAAEPLTSEPRYDETEVSAGALSGTFLNAGAQSPIIVIVPGSGPTDRDGNSGRFVSNALKFLAQGLADKNISTIRVDKRGMFGSAAAGDGNKVTVEIYAEDYRAWTKKALELSGQDCAYLLGHSEGGLMVSAAAVGQDNVCGIITIAGPGRPLNVVLREQLNANPANAPVMKDAETALQALEGGDKVDVSNFHPALKGLFNPVVQDYLISLFAADPAEILTAANCPSLVIQGAHDIQVTADDARRLVEKSGAQLVMVPALNHVLKTAPQERGANIRLYNSPDVPIDPRVTDAVANFIYENK